MARTPRTDALVSRREAPASPPSAPQKRLDVFPNPTPGRDYVIQFDIPEFTCNCPLTGQPDFARFTIDIVADRLCIELKSLKLYFWSFRDQGAFHEKVTNTIASDIIRAIDPRKLTVEGNFFVRGGIGTLVTVTHEKKAGARTKKAARRPRPVPRRK